MGWGRPGPQRAACGPRSAYDVEGRRPDLFERVDRLEKQVAHTADTVHEQHSELRDSLRHEMARAATEAMAVAHERDVALRTFISGQLAGGVRRGGVGAVLFALGVLASAVANLIG